MEAYLMAVLLELIRRKIVESGNKKTIKRFDEICECCKPDYSKKAYNTALERLAYHPDIRPVVVSISADMAEGVLKLAGGVAGEILEAVGGVLKEGGK